MVELVVEPDRLRRAASGAVTGPIHFAVGDGCFPEEGWSDFPVAILGWWLEAIGRLEKGVSRTEDLDFMDGPCLVRVTVRFGDTAHLEFRAERGQGSREVSESVSLRRLAEIVRLAAATLLEACARQGWSDRDIDLLSGVGVD